MTLVFPVHGRLTPEGAAPGRPVPPGRAVGSVWGPERSRPRVARETVQPPAMPSTGPAGILRGHRTKGSARTFTCTRVTWQSQIVGDLERFSGGVISFALRGS